MTVTNVTPTVGAITPERAETGGLAGHDQRVITDPGWLDTFDDDGQLGRRDGHGGAERDRENDRPNATFTYSNVTHAYGTTACTRSQVCATDDEPASDCNMRNVTITNVPPSVGPITTNGPKPENTAITISGRSPIRAGWIR